MTLFLEAFLLALASSTDNFVVGLSVGIANRSLSFAANALISICNAFGGWLAVFWGSALGRRLPPYVSPMLSAIIFGGLATREFCEFRHMARRKQKKNNRLVEGNVADASKHLRANMSGSSSIANSETTIRRKSSSNKIGRAHV